MLLASLYASFGLVFPPPDSSRDSGLLDWFTRHYLAAQDQEIWIWDDLFMPWQAQLQPQLLLSPTLIEEIAPLTGWRILAKEILATDADDPRGILHIRWKMQRYTPELRIANRQPQDIPACIELFNQAFERHGMNEAVLRWKSNEASYSILAWQGTQLVSHNAMFPRELMWKNQLIAGFQVGDVMTRPNVRIAGGRFQSAFYQVARAQAYLSLGTDFVQGFGFPNARAFQIAHVLQLYDAVDYMVALYWQNPQPAWHQEPMQPLDPIAIGAMIPAAWNQMKQSFAENMIGCRDNAWLDYRYQQHPQGHQYRYGRYRTTLVIWREDAGNWQLMDLVGDQQTFAQAISAWLAYGKSHHIAQFSAWFTRSHARLLCGSGARWQDLKLTIPSSRILAHIPATNQYEKWWLMMGDTDFL